MTDDPRAQTELLLRRALAPVLQNPQEVPEAVVRGAVRRGRRRRRARRAGVALVPLVAAVAVAATVVTVRFSATSPAGPPAGATPLPGWRPAATAPLSARSDPTVVQVGGDVVVLGGSAAAPCPPNAACAAEPEGALDDGAVYDPDRDVWRRIARAPVGLLDISAAASGTSVYVLTRPRPGSGRGQQMWEYSLTADRWTRMPAPPHRMDVVVAAGDHRLVAYVRDHTQGWTADRSYDIAARTWSPLPRDPLAPSEERTLVATGSGLVLIAVDSPWRPGGPMYPPWRTARWDAGTGSWREIPTPGIVDSEATWRWVGGRVVNPATETVEQGGRLVATGGILDPVRGTWQAVPAPPAPGPGSAYPGLGAAGSGRVLVRGELLDVRSRTWTRLPQPPARFPIQDAGAIVVGDRVIVVGGVVSVSDRVTATNGTWVLRLPPSP